MVVDTDFVIALTVTLTVTVFYNTIVVTVEVLVLINIAIVFNNINKVLLKFVGFVDYSF